MAEPIFYPMFDAFSDPVKRSIDAFLAKHLPYSPIEGHPLVELTEAELSQVREVLVDGEEFTRAFRPVGKRKIAMVVAHSMLVILLCVVLASVALLTDDWSSAAVFLVPVLFALSIFYVIVGTYVEKGRFFLVTNKARFIMGHPAVCVCASARFSFVVVDLSDENKRFQVFQEYVFF
jgi:hypothetical protein